MRRGRIGGGARVMLIPLPADPAGFIRSQHRAG